MKLKTRDFVKNLASAKAAAARGKTVEIVDGRSGTTYHLVAVRKRLTFREVAEKDAGIVSTGRRDDD
jgi:hypothetical protein